MTNPNPYREGPMILKSKNRKPQAVRQPKTIIYARCIRTRKGIGARIKDIFQTTYSESQWAKGPLCPNCGGAMVEVRRGRMPL